MIFRLVSRLKGVDRIQLQSESRRQYNSPIDGKKYFIEPLASLLTSVRCLLLATTTVLYQGVSTGHFSTSCPMGLQVWVLNLAIRQWGYREPLQTRLTLVPKTGNDIMAATLVYRLLFFLGIQHSLGFWSRSSISSGSGIVTRLRSGGSSKNVSTSADDEA